MLKNLIFGRYEGVWRVQPTDFCNLCRKQMAAQERGDVKTAQLLTDQIFMALVNRPQDKHYAEVDRFTIAFLEEMKPNLAATDVEGRTPLMLALKNRRTDVALKILQHPQDLNVQDCMHATALVYASAYGENAGVRALLELGADTEIAGPAGLTAVQYAANETIYTMIKRQAALNALKTYRHKPPQEQQSAQQESTNALNARVLTAANQNAQSR